MAIAAAALNYFDKSLDELTVAEAALLAGLPKAPSCYDPSQNPDAALQRRNYVIGRMQEDGYITPAEADDGAGRADRAAPAVGDQTAEADFFIEEVRRQLVARLGEQGFYEGGLSVRVTLSPTLQATADRALRHGLCRLRSPPRAGAAPGAAGSRCRRRRGLAGRWLPSTRASSSATGGGASCCRAQGRARRDRPGRRRARPAAAPTMSAGPSASR